MISWHLATWFGIVWAVGALLSFFYTVAIGDIADLSGSAGASQNLLNQALSPSNTILNNPTLGETNNPLEITFSLLILAKDWTLFAIRSLALDYEFFGDNTFTQTIRWVLLAFAAPFAVNLAILGSEFIARMVRGLSSLPIPFLGRT